MATRKQRAANRRNAQLSTGPKTPEGKDAVRLNALKHGLTAQDAVIFPEDDEAFYELRNNFLDQLQPATPLETALVHQIIMAQWRLARIRRLGTGLFGLGYIENEEDMNQEYTNLPPCSRLAYVFQKNSEVLATLSRYEARIERAFYSALHELQSLQAPRQNQFCRTNPIQPRTRPQSHGPQRLTPARRTHFLLHVAACPQQQPSICP